MPVELAQVLVQLGIGGVFIWYLQRLVDKQADLIERKDARIAELYQRIEDVRNEERRKADADCAERDERIEQLRKERDDEREQRFAAAADARDYLWQIANALNHLTQRERGERPGGDAPDDLRLGSGGGGEAAG